ncbi:MAG: ATP-sensitive inward rectifier potassium channel 10 [Gammaproteobacteria bacterium]|nr:ATP-sensitive inward rectifier potassium channel 10 [Gammaproteobacteria bacterium]MBQ0839186.1 ATP-sensitive inward rectifier potassium channel 10 [Gammaproteobacteria bacterium]
MATPPDKTAAPTTERTQMPPPTVKNSRTFHVHTKGLNNSLLSDFYYRVMLATWPQFFIGAVLVYLCINAGFALIYFLGGDMILNARPNSFIDAYIFSFQTSTTIGYGYLLPKNGITHAIVMVDVFSGLLFVAVLTGLVFARFAKPRASVLFGKQVLITQHCGQPTLLVRLANGRQRSSIVNCRVSAVLMMEDRNPDSIFERRFLDLKLERDHIPIFTLTWTLVHTIDEQSPLYGLDKAAIESYGTILIITLDGIEDVFAQTAHTNHIYEAGHFLFNKRFADILSRHKDGSRMIDYTRFYDVEDVD